MISDECFLVAILKAICVKLPQIFKCLNCGFHLLSMDLEIHPGPLLPNNVVSSALDLKHSLTQLSCSVQKNPFSYRTLKATPTPQGS